MTGEEADAQSEAARKLFAGACDFVAGAAVLDAIPPDTLPEIAFVGRSNVGKSSLINALTGRKALARISITPGRTQQLNFFNLGGRLMLVDLPGYGYAKVSKRQQEQWQRLMKGYLRGRSSLARVCLLVDSRHELKESDEQMMRLLDDAAVSYQLIGTKADKVKAPERMKIRGALEAAAARHAAAYPEILFTSSETGESIEEMRTALSAFALSK